MWGGYGQFEGIDPVSVYDPLYGPSALSPYGQHWIPTTKANYAWALVGYDPQNPPVVNFSDPNVTIAIIDTGIDQNHPEFFGNGQTFSSKIHPDSRTFVEGDESLPGLLSCPCDPSSYAVEDVEDTLWLALPGAINPHGTISAGIAAAYAGNGEGIAGICWESSLLVLRVSAVTVNTQAPGCTLELEACIYTAQTIAAAINYAAGWNPDDGTWGPVRARVISIATTSIPGYDSSAEFCDPQGPLNIAIDEAHARGCVIVAIAGNRLENCWSDDYPNEPTCTPVANFPDYPIDQPLAWHPKTIAVGGTCRTGMNWHCRSRINPPIGDLGTCGDDYYPVRPINDTAPVLSVVAPIEDIVSTFSYDDQSNPPVGALYGFVDAYSSGTSWAAPQVAGVVALMLKMNQALTPDQVKYILEVTATDIDDLGYDRRTGYGLINAQKAVEYAIKQGLPADWNGDGSVGPIDPVLYVADYAAGDPTADLNLDTMQTTDDMAIFLNSYAGN